MSARLLVCEDDPAIGRALHMKLTRGGHDVVLAFNGREGWESFGTRRPDLIITDYQMPEMDGLEFSSRVRATEQGRSIPIILLTAKQYELDDHEQIPELRFSEIVAKPFSPREIVIMIERLLADAGPESLSESNDCRAHGDKA